jgi:hypothetical protein
MQDNDLETGQEEGFQGYLVVFCTIVSYWIFWFIASFIYLICAYYFFSVNVNSPFGGEVDLVLVGVWGVRFLLSSFLPILLACIVGSALVATIVYTGGRSREAQWIVRTLCAGIIGTSIWIAMDQAIPVFNNQIQYQNLQFLSFPTWPAFVSGMLMAIISLFYSRTYPPISKPQKKRTVHNKLSSNTQCGVVATIFGVIVLSTFFIGQIGPVLWFLLFPIGGVVVFVALAIYSETGV